MYETLRLFDNACTIALAASIFRKVTNASPALSNAREMVAAASASPSARITAACRSCSAWRNGEWVVSGCCLRWGDGTRCTNLFNDEFGALGVCNVSGWSNVIEPKHWLTLLGNLLRFNRLIEGLSSALLHLTRQLLTCVNSWKRQGLGYLPNVGFRVRTLPKVR